jgi:bifunctional enzyme CysN/CysC
MTIAITNQLRQTPTSPRDLVRIVIVGHVDHGKSTLIGRLLHETGSLQDGKLETLKAVSERRGMAFEWSFLLDALQTERDHGITIDTSQIRFRTPSRDVVLIDAPGHTEFLRNMITGAAQADAAILIVDAAEGVRDQTRRHGYLLHLLGIRQVVVVINKMDRVGYSASRFDDVRDTIVSYLETFKLRPVSVIPISAREGDGVARHSEALAWHRGPAVVEALEGFQPAARLAELPLRLPIQAVYRFDDRRIIAGRIESGELSVGDDIVVMPGNKTAKVRSIEAWPAPSGLPAVRRAGAGQSIGVTLDRELFIDRGHVVATPAASPPAGRTIEARVFWLHPASLDVGRRLIVRSGAAECVGLVRAIRNAVDPADLGGPSVASIAHNHVGDIEIALAMPLAADPSAWPRSRGSASRWVTTATSCCAK